MNNVAPKDWGRWATLGLAACAHLAGVIAVTPMVIWWYGDNLTHITAADIRSDGVAAALMAAVSTLVQIVLLVLFAQRTGESAASYLGWIWPRRSHVVFGIICVVALMILGDGISWLIGHDMVSPFQTSITESARAAEGFVWLVLAFAVVVPIGEETLFCGFLFRGWLKSLRNPWPVIGATSLIFALLHVQYDAFGMAEMFAFGLLFGWMRWVSGSSILTMFLYGLFNLGSMVVTLLFLQYH